MNDPAPDRIVAFVDSLTVQQARRLREILDTSTGTGYLHNYLHAVFFPATTIASESRDYPPEDDLAMITSPEAYRSTVEDTTSHKRILTMLLEDRDALPTTKDVIRVVNNALDYRFNFSDFSKAGRAKLVERCWKLMQRKSDVEQVAIINSILKQLPPNSRAGLDYQRMFRFLTRDER